MFLDKLHKENPMLLRTITELHQEGRLLPDSYVIDMDQLLENAKMILKEAKKRNIRLFFMLKQIGRNPYIAQELISLGYEGAVVVDFREAEIMMDHNIPICNIGHLVQVPEALLERVIAYGPEFITVYSLEKCASINREAAKLGRRQKLLLRITDDKDAIYSGQTAGIRLQELPEFIEKLKAYENIQVAGITSFPCYLYSAEAKKIEATNNLTTLKEAEKILKDLGIELEMINTPSATCVETLRLMEKEGVNGGEPGHGLTGTTPAHIELDLVEKPCVAYLSEVSHNYDGKGYCYGGGYYRRSGVKESLVGMNYDTMRSLEVIPPDMESIDYHFALSGEGRVGETVIMAFRFQIFMTRSDLVLIRGIRSSKPEIIDIYDSRGYRK